MAVVDEDVPAGVMHVPVMSFAQPNAIIYTGFTTIDPVSPVMRLAHSRGPITARKNTSSNLRDECSANG